MKLLPFDLTKAQAGHPWGTRDGRKGKKIFDTKRKGDLRLITVLEDNTQFCHSIDGSYFPHKSKSDLDLFLYEEEKIGWVVIYKTREFIDTVTLRDESVKNASEEYFRRIGTYIQTVEVRY